MTFITNTIRKAPRLRLQMPTVLMGLLIERLLTKGISYTA